MNDPYEVLGVSRDAGEAEIRGRYLELVREFPPDRAPERFTAIRAAYDEARNPARRLEMLLFRPEATESLDALANDLRAMLREARIPVKDLLALAESP
jgi:curved DNA-binding protein CbpA